MKESPGKTLLDKPAVAPRMLRFDFFNGLLSLREAAVDAAASTGRPEAEEPLMALLNTPGSKLRVQCLLALAKLKPDVHLPRTLGVILDRAVALEERERLAQGVFWTIGSNQLQHYTDKLLAGIKSEKPDGAPADFIRVFMWKAYNKTTGKEPPLEVIDDKLAYRWLAYDIRQRTIRKNVHASQEEIRRLVDSKIKSILTTQSRKNGGQQP